MSSAGWGKLALTQGRKTMPEKAIGKADIHVREVTHYQVAWTQQQLGEPGVFTIQLILDQGADEYVIRATADDVDVMTDMFKRGEKVYFDLDRKVLMFGTLAV
jgi:hypothetical protein